MSSPSATRDLRYIVQRSADLTNINGWLEIYRYDSSTGVITRSGVTSTDNAGIEIIMVNDPTAGTGLYWRLKIDQIP